MAASQHSSQLLPDHERELQLLRGDAVAAPLEAGTITATATAADDGSAAHKENENDDADDVTFFPLINCETDDDDVGDCNGGGEGGAAQPWPLASANPLMGGSANDDMPTNFSYLQQPPTASVGPHVNFDMLAASLDVDNLASQPCSTAMSPPMPSSTLGKGASGAVLRASLSVQSLGQQSTSEEKSGTSTCCSSQVAVPPLSGPLCPHAESSLDIDVDDNDDSSAGGGVRCVLRSASVSPRENANAISPTVWAPRLSTSFSSSVPVAVKKIIEKDETRRYAASCELAFFRRYQLCPRVGGPYRDFYCAPIYELEGSPTLVASGGSADDLTSPVLFECCTHAGAFPAGTDGCSGECSWELRHLVHVMSVSRNAAARETTVVMEQLPGTTVTDIPALAAVRELTTNAATANAATPKPTNPTLSEVDAALRVVAGDVARGLRSLHEELRVVHRDVKPANLLLDHSGRVKVGDFGVSAVLPMSPETNTDTDHDASDDASGLPTDQLGTFGYMAPERLRGEAHGPASDVWSLGVTLLELALGRRPFGATGSGTEGFWRTASAIGALEGASGGGGGDGARTASAAVEGALAECADRTSAGFRGFVRRCLAFSPSERASALSLAEDAWVAAAPASYSAPAEA